MSQTEDMTWKTREIVKSARVLPGGLGVGEIRGGGSNNKKDHAAGKNPRCPLSFCSFLFFFKTR